MVTKWKIFELKEVRVQCDWQMDGVICNVIVQSYEDEFDFRFSDRETST